MLSMENHIKSLALLLITKLGQHSIILCRLWMKKHRVLLDMIYDSITFFSRFCMYLRTSLSFIPPKPIEETKEISEAKQQQDIISNRILKRGSIENLNSFLKTTEKIVRKKRRLAIAFKQKSNIGKQNSKIVIFNTFGNSGKEELPTSTLATIFEQDVENVAMIDADAYRLACQLKRAQVFAILMKDLEFQAEKEARPETNLKTVVPKKYYDLLYVFSKKDSDTLPSHRKYDYKIILEKEQKHGYASLYKMLLQELDAVKHYLDSDLVKGFIQASSALYLSPVLFVQKLSGGIRFCVDYQRLNTITKKDQYSISLIKEILAQLKSTKYFTKIDIE